jgi:hypothetical protein
MTAARLENPADVDLSVIAPGENVFLRGLGLNFFDYMALLTIEEVETKTTQENVLPGSNNRKINICWVRGRDVVNHALEPSRC